MWKETTIDLGEVTPQSTHIIEFIYTGDKQILKVTASCGCTDTTITRDGVKVTYIAPRLDMVEKITSSKFLDVEFTDMSIDRLTIRAVITK